MFPSWILVSLTTFLVFRDVSGQWEAILNLPKGDVKGSVERLASGGEYTAFRGIPYAKPPKESLRLRDPEEPDAWSSIYDATNFRSKCPQWDARQGNMAGDEDCLYINVYTPLSLVGGGSRLTQYPVMVFIHGGNFQRGSADAYGPEWFIQKGVVLVTFNYRVGVLGFLSTGDSSCPGNLGLKDQALALKWVQENIGKFGGNSSSITLFGQGAGAASVFLHILSPRSQGLFHHAITQSGSPLCDWTVEENPRSYAVEIAKKLGCKTKSNSDMVGCIRGKPLKDILEAQKDEKTFGDYPLRAVPVVEKEGFLPDTPAKLLSTGNFKPVPLMSGINKDEGAVFYPLILSYQEMLRKNSSFLVSRLLPMFLLTATDIRGNIGSVSQAIHFQYFDGVDTANASQVLEAFINMTTDAMFVSCNYRTLQNYSTKGAKTYMYSFEYKGEYSMLELEEGKRLGYKGVSHGDELLYLFNLKGADLRDSEDNKKKEQLHYLWTTFAKTGETPVDFNFEFPKWQPYTADTKFFYRIDRLLQSSASYRQREVDFWLRHLPALSAIRDGPDVQYQTGGFGWAMLAVALVLLVCAVVLAVLLFRAKKSHYFTTKTEDK